MGENENPSVFDAHIKGYLEQVSRLDFALLTERLGVAPSGKAAVVPLLGEPFRVSAAGVVDERGRTAGYAAAVVLCKYLLLCPNFHPTDDRWQAYRDFPDAAPLVTYFTDQVERAVTGRFAGRLNRLRRAAEALGARRPLVALSHDFSARIEVLPRIPVLLTFNDADDEFPAACSVLFEQRARHYLDMECLAMVGGLLAHRLGAIDETV